MPSAYLIPLVPPVQVKRFHLRVKSSTIPILHAPSSPTPLDRRGVPYIPQNAFSIIVPLHLMRMCQQQFANQIAGHTHPEGKPN